jgi:hypothetical protein
MCNARTPTADDLPWNRRVTRRDLLKYGGMLGFSAVGASMLAACTPFQEFGERPVPADGAVPPAEAKYLAIMILDAGRGDYLTRGHFPNFKYLIDNGAHYPNAWCGQMQAVTPASHATIGTGLFPKHDGGILGFWWENPETSQKFTCADLINSTHAHEPGGRHAVDPTVITDILRDNGGPSISSLMKQHDPSAKIFAASGNKYYAAEGLGGVAADYIAYFWNDGRKKYRPICAPGRELPREILSDPALTTHDYVPMIDPSPSMLISDNKSFFVDEYVNLHGHPGQQDSLVVDLAIKVLQRERPRIMMLNLPELDWPVAHLFGGWSLSPKFTDQHLANADDALGRLFDAYRELGIFDQTVFCVMGDHGVSPLEQVIDLSQVQYAVANAGTWIVDNDYHSSAFVWIADPTLAMKCTTFIDDLNLVGVHGVYFLADLAGTRRYMPSEVTQRNLSPELDRAYRHLLETMNGPTAPHIALMYAERHGTMGVGKGWVGDHGGPSWGSQSLAMVMAGPGIRKGFQSAYPARLVDVAPTALRLLGAPYPPLDGVALADAFMSPTAKETRAQGAVDRVLRPISTVLRAQSSDDIRGLASNNPYLHTKSGVSTVGGANYH